MRKLQLYYYYLLYKLRNAVNLREKDRVNGRYAGKPIVGEEAFFDGIREALTSKKPYMVGRFGAVEQFVMRAWEFNQTAKQDKACNQLYSCAGFFPEEKTLMPEFADTMKQAAAQADVLGVWYQPCEDYFIRHYCREMKQAVMLKLIEPWNNENPWTRVLEGRKVLVVHPFEESIRMQYRKRENLFENKNMLPEFELKTLKAVQTAGDARDERFNNWFEALQYMCDEVDKIDYDIALLGCGAYGFPLAAHIKRQGKVAVHMGGSLQILFGIKGKRWDELFPNVNRMYNEYWEYPLDSEVPKNHGVVEGGTYWK